MVATGQQDFFSVQTASFTGPMTFRLQTAGISLLAPELIVYDASGNILGQAASTTISGDTVSVQLNSATANTTYYIGVEAATTGNFAVGRYGLAVTFDATLKTSPAQIASMLRDHGGSANSSDDGTPGGVVALRTTRGYAAHEHYQTTNSFAKAVTYSVQAPTGPAGATQVLTVTLSTSGTSGDGASLPQVQVLDANQQPIATQVLVSKSGKYTIQASGLASGQTYYLTLTPAATGGGDDTSVALVAAFDEGSTILPVLASGTATTAASPPTYALYAALDQVFSFTLSAAGTGAPAKSTVRMTITDSKGNVVYNLTAAAGQTVTGPPVLLNPGAYTVSFAIVTPGGAPGSLSFQLLGGSITDPIGPVITDPTYTPMYTNPGNPFIYYYPDGTVSVSPFLLVALVL
jgi:hypothetical protein